MTLSERFQTARNSKSFRLWLMVILLAILLYMYFFVGKMKILLLVLMVFLAGAIGVEVSNYDIDLGKLRESGSIQESRVQTKNGVTIFGNCVSDDINCANFKTQGEAQAKYEQCAEQIKNDNTQLKDSQEVKNLDIYGLDGDKDGTVCEALPKG